MLARGSLFQESKPCSQWQGLDPSDKALSSLQQNLLPWRLTLVDHKALALIGQTPLFPDDQALPTRASPTHNDQAPPTDNKLLPQ